MNVNLYDFDNTIYDGDSSVDFYLFCLKRKLSIIKYLPIFIIYFFLYIIKIKSKEEMKEKFFAFLKSFDDIDELVIEFWNKNDKKIKKFYLDKNHSNDIIVSASPEFLLLPISKKLKVKKLIASEVDKTNGKFLSKNCHGSEKVKRINQFNDNLKINEVYSDSTSDIPIFEMGKKCYLVNKDKIVLLDKKDFKNNKKVNILKIMFGIMFVFSTPVLTFIVSGNYDINYIKILLIASFITSIFLYFMIIKKDIYNKINFKLLIFSIVFGLFTISEITPLVELSNLIYLSNSINKLFGLYLNENLLKTIISILSIPSVIIFVYYFSKKIYNFVKIEYFKFSKMEKIFLLLVLIFGFLASFIIFSKTNSFYGPGKTTYDVIYTADSWTLNFYNSFLKISSIENDIHQPLFALFSLPFNILARFLSLFVSFIPNSYYIVFNTIQIFLLFLSIVLIERMLKLKENKLLFLLFFASSFGVILFSFVYEQYIISLFYLILAIYIWYFYKYNVNYSYIGAVGTMITSGVIFPLLSNTKKFKQYIKNAFKCFIACVITFIISGQILLLLDLKGRIIGLMRFSGTNIIFIDKLKQFLYFVQSIFIAPKGNTVFNFGYPSYDLIDVNFVSIIGIIILLLCFISFILNRKNKFALISFLWIIFSFLILCIVGWGTQENGLILYSLYFSFAYISLIYLLIDKIKIKKIKYIILISLIVIMLYFNVTEFLKILKFSLTYYRI